MTSAHHRLSSGLTTVLKGNRTILLLFMMAAQCVLFLACGGGGGGGADNPPAETAPVITQGPVGVTAQFNQMAIFTVMARGTAPLQYEWKKAGISVETGSASFTIASAQASDAGSYTVTVSNSAGSVTSAPATLTVNSGNLSSQITQYGITWSFDKAYPVGQFVNGDYWVVGPVNIVGIIPGSQVLGDGRIVSGSMLNPAISTNQGYDSRIYGYGTGRDAGYVASLNAGRPNGQELSASNPLVIHNPASLITGISYLENPDNKMNQVHLMAVLTILNAVPPSGSFRPPFTGTDKSIRHTVSEMRYDLLPQIAPLETVQGIPDINALSAKFQKVWPEHMEQWLKERFLPKDNMPNYGREVGALVSDGALMLVIHATGDEKRLLAMRMVQIGLDYYGLLQQPGGKTLWIANGGHHCGRTFPLLLAAHLLQDPVMLRVMEKSGQYAYQDSKFSEGNLPPDYIHFGEIDQTFYVTQRDVDRTHSALWNPDLRDNTPEPYETSDIGKPDWGIEHAQEPVHDNAAHDSNYRQVCSVSFTGFALAARIMKMQKLYNHPAFFDYVDRWTTLGYPVAKTPPYGTVGQFYNTFQMTMWKTYRPLYDEAAH